MKCFVISVLSLVVLAHVVLADDDGFEDDLTFDERQTLRRNGKIYRSNRRGRGRKGEVERDAKVLVKRDESLQRRMDSVQDNDESDVEKRERGWLKSSRVLNSGQEEELLKRLVDDLEKTAFEKREQGWAVKNPRLKKGELLEKRMDEGEDEEESDVEKREQGWGNQDPELSKKLGLEKREQGWAVKNARLRKGEELEKRMDQAEEILDLEKRQLNKPNPRFRQFGQARL